MKKTTSFENIGWGDYVIPLTFSKWRSQSLNQESPVLALGSVKRI